MKVRATRHNGRAGKNGVYNPLHNDRRFNVENSEHIDPERTKYNIYWDCYQGYNLQTDEERILYSFKEIEKLYYVEHYSDFVDAQNERNIKYHHPERNREVQNLLDDKRTCPEETIFQLGNIDGSVTPDILAKVTAEYMEEFEKRYGSNVHVLDWTLHLDESTPHIHERHVFDSLNKYGELCPQQEKALEDLGFELPYPTRKRSKVNNRKISFDAECRKLFIDIAERNGVSIELEVISGGKSYLEKQDFIIENQKVRIAENEKQLDNLTMKISDVEQVIDEAIDLAYDKAVEVITDTVKEETIKHDVEVIKEYGDYVSALPKEKVNDKAKGVVSKAIDAIVARIEKASQILLGRIVNTLQEPKIKEKSKEQIKEKAKNSILDKLKIAQEQVKETERATPHTKRKQDIEH